MARQLTIAQLEKLLTSKRTRLESLRKKKELLEKDLAKVEQKIVDIGGVIPGGRKASRGRRGQNPRSVKQMMIEILLSNKKGLTLEDLSAQVVANGYKTTSANFKATVYQTIYNNQKHFTYDPETRVYKLRTDKPKAEKSKSAS